MSLPASLDQPGPPRHDHRRQLAEIPLTATGCIILAGVRVSVNVQFGDFTILNLNASVSHDCRLHDFCNICPGVNLSGNVEVGAGTFLGTNTSVVNGGATRA